MVILGCVVDMVDNKVDFFVFGKFIKFILVNSFNFKIIISFCMGFFGCVKCGVWWVVVWKC